MSIFSRIFKIGQAKANQVVDKFEKPELMLEQAIRDKEKQLREAKKAVQDCIATERQAKAMYEKELRSQKEWEAKAEAALHSGREDLAGKALTRAAEHEQKSKSLEVQWQNQRKSVESLKQDIQKFDDELAEYKRNKDFIIAQSKAAEVKKSIYEAKAKIGTDRKADDLMERMRAKAERASYQADAAEEMAESFTGDSLEKEFDELNATASSPDIQDKLAAMKAKMKSSE